MGSFRRLRKWRADEVGRPFAHMSTSMAMQLILAQFAANIDDTHRGTANAFACSPTQPKSQRAWPRSF
jgi:hypothetical protein